MNRNSSPFKWRHYAPDEDAPVPFDDALRGFAALNGW